ncbi:MAG: alpha/beta hydrolase family protein [Gammaproteobacteria bacterium]|nr:alpha/beta hydrolase family protein [Gammaproteobacteria bacterium]
MWRVVCLALLLSLNIHAQQALSYSQLQVDDLKRQLPAAEISQIDATEPVLLLQRPAMTASRKGTVILLADSAEHAASPKHIDNLRQQLNDYGWDTLSVMPPDAAMLTGDSDAIQQFQTAVMQRISAAQQQARQQSGSVVVIAQGNSAAVLNQLYVAEQLAEPEALILLGAYLPDPQLNIELAKAIASHQIPTLDINHQYDNRFVNAQLALRQKWVNKQLKPVYRQRQIIGSGLHQEVQQWVLHEIYGWLTSIGL